MAAGSSGTCHTPGNAHLKDARKQISTYLIKIWNNWPLANFHMEIAS